MPAAGIQAILFSVLMTEMRMMMSCAPYATGDINTIWGYMGKIILY